MDCLQKTKPLFLIFIALVLASSLPSAFSEENREDSLRDLCTDNFRPYQCWEIIKANYDGFNTDNVTATNTAIDLARGKAVEILDLLNQLNNDSDNEDLKQKYRLCINNYNDAIRDIDQAKSYLDSGNYGNCDEMVSSQIHTVLDDFQECRHSFNGTWFDPAHVLDRNHEFFVYSQLAMAASGRVN